MQPNLDDKIWKMAQKRVSFRRHGIVFILVNIALAVIWYLSWDQTAERGPLTYWFLYTFCGWGIGLVIHYWNAYHDDESSVEREYNKLKETKIVLPEDKPAEQIKSGNENQ